VNSHDHALCTYSYPPKTRNSNMKYAKIPNPGRMYTKDSNPCTLIAVSGKSSKSWKITVYVPTGPSKAGESASDSPVGDPLSKVRAPPV